MEQIKTVALIGLGGIGCSVSRELCRAVGYENLRVLAGGARRERLEQQGVTINGENCHFQIVSPGEQTTPADLVIVTGKFGGLEQAIQDIAGTVGGNTIILHFLNGTSAEKMIAGSFGWELVI